MTYQQDLTVSALKQQLQPKVEELSLLMQQRRESLMGQAYLVLPVVVIGFLFFSWLFSLIIPAWLFWHLRTYKAAVRQEVLKPFVGAFGAQYKPEGLQALYERANKHGLLPSHTEVDLKDAIQGKYADLSFQLTEFKLKAKSHQQADIQIGRHHLNMPFKRKQKVFEGMALMLQLPFDVPTPVLLQKDVHEKAGIKQWQARFKGLKPVSVNQPSFETEYQIFALDTEDAAQLLSHEFTMAFLSLMNQIKLKSAHKNMFGFVFKPQLQAVAWRKQLLLTIDTNQRFMEPEFFIRFTKSHWAEQFIDFMAQLKTTLSALQKATETQKAQALKPTPLKSETKHLKLVKEAG